MLRGICIYNNFSYNYFSSAHLKFIGLYQFQFSSVDGLVPIMVSNFLVRA